MHIVPARAIGIKYDCPDKIKYHKKNKKEKIMSKPEHEKHCKCKECTSIVAGHDHEKKHPNKPEKCDK